MTQLTHMTGNIFETTAYGIAQGVNTRGVMGAGIAKQFREFFPEMYEYYRLECENHRLQGGDVLPWRQDYPTGVTTYVFNVASQELPGSNASYDFLAQGVRTTLEWASFYGLDRVAFPRIGSGIGGLNEGVVEAILEALAKQSPVDIELWTYKP